MPVALELALLETKKEEETYSILLRKWKAFLSFKNLYYKFCNQNIVEAACLLISCKRLFGSNNWKAAIERTKFVAEHNSAVLIWTPALFAHSSRQFRQFRRFCKHQLRLQATSQTADRPVAKESKQSALPIELQWLKLMVSYLYVNYRYFQWLAVPPLVRKLI